MRRLLGFFFLCLIFRSCLLGQSDSLSHGKLTGVVGMGAVSSSNEFLPFYIKSNRWGEVIEDQTTFVKGQIAYQYVFNRNFNLATGFSFRNDILSSHYISLNYDFLRLDVGRLKNRIGGLESSLSSGSLGISENSRPIPSIYLGIHEYIDVPFTQGYFKAKGHLGHGWLEEERYISNALLHSKSFYLKLDLEKEIGWTAASGIVHFAQFGGISPQGEAQPDSFSDFLRVFVGSGIPNPDGTTAGESNGLGNHLGIVETSVTQLIGQNKLTINYQKPFEDFGSLQYISLTDYLIGLEWDLPKSNGLLIEKLYVEYLQTKWQGGPGLPDATEAVKTEQDNFGYQFGGRDDNYNNFLYRSGWTYQGQVVGNPLFLTYERTRNFLTSYPDYGVTIVNNRIRATHFGIKGSLNASLSYEGKFTYSQNFGTYAGLYEGRFAWNGVASDSNFDYVFRPMIEQVYTQLWFRYDEVFRELPISLELRLAYDFGGFYSAFGSEFSISYDLTKG